MLLTWRSCCFLFISMTSTASVVRAGGGVMKGGRRSMPLRLTMTTARRRAQEGRQRPRRTWHSKNDALQAAPRPSCPRVRCPPEPPATTAVRRAAGAAQGRTQGIIP